VKQTNAIAVFLPIKEVKRDAHAEDEVSINATKAWK
jgi:hypothetical protein